MRLIDENGITIGLAPYLSQPKQVKKAFRHKSALAHPAAMYRRDVALKVGGYRQKYAPAEDLDLWLRMLDFGEIGNLPSEVIKYRIHSHQTSRENLTKQSLAKVNVYWDKRRGLNEKNHKLSCWQNFRIKVMATSESYIVKSVDEVRAKRLGRAIYFVILSTVLNPLNMWRTVGSFLTVRITRNRPMIRSSWRRS